MSKTMKMNASGETRPRLSFRRAQVVVITILIACIALAAASANRNKTAPTAKAPGPIISKPTPAASQGAASSQGRYLRRAYLTPEVQTILAVQGDRFERPGKERLVLMGTLTRPGDTGKEAHAFRLIREFPARLRLEEQVGLQTQLNSQRREGSGLTLLTFELFAR